MVSRNNAVFRFVLDIKDFIVKGRRVVQVTNEITGSTTKASGSMDRLSTSTAKTGQSMAANAVNFQTATQGMLNLSTAGVQTFTSFSNLDRAGNRLAMAQIGVSRATDLLNNKQLRLNELQERGLGSSQKATLLTNELKTARADLLVKTDKLKIEEGALFDIQLLFVTNIANVMISSMQTIVSLKQAHIFTTIKQIVQERLLATTLFTKTVPGFTAATGSISAYNTAAKTTISTNRLLMVGIPVIGTVLLGVSLAWQAYTDNLGGFRDMVQTVLPFLKDKKELLGDVNEILNETTDSQDLFNKSLDAESKLLFDLPKSLNLTAEGLAKINKELRGSNIDNLKKYNFELAKTTELSPDFRSASLGGGLQPTTGNTSNVIKHEGDTRYTASAISAPGFQLAFAGGFYNRPIYQNQEYVNQSGNYVNIDTRGNKVVSPFPMVTGQDRLKEFIQVISKGAGRVVGSFGALSKEVSKNIVFSSLSGSLSVFKKDINESFARFEGFESAVQKKTIEQQRQELLDIHPSTSLMERNKQFIFSNIPKPGRGKFVGGRIISPTTGIIFGTKSFEKLKGDLLNKSSELYEIYSMEEIKQFEDMVYQVEHDPNAAALILRQDDVIKSTGLNIVTTPEQQKKFFDDLKFEKSKIDALRVNAEVVEAERKGQLEDLRLGATQAGLSVFEFVKRKQLGIIGRHVTTRPNLSLGGATFGISSVDEIRANPILRGLTEDQKKRLKEMNVIFRIGSEDELFTPEKVIQARKIRKELEAGDFRGLPMDTQFNRLIRRSFGRTGGIQLSSGDPLLRDISGFGVNRAAVFTERRIDQFTGADLGIMGTDIGAVADSISIQEAKRLGELQRVLNTFTGTSGGLASAAIAAVGANATQAFQVSSVATPSHILERQARERAHRYSREGIRERILSDRLYYADPAAGKAYTGLDKTQASLFKSYGGEAGLFAPGELDRLEFLFRSGLEEIPTDIPGFSALGLMSLAKGAGVASQAWDTRRSRSGDIEAARINRAAGVANTVLNHSLERLVQGNFGGFESTVLYGINNYFEQPLGGALVEERQIFDTQIDPVLKIGFKAFSKVLQDSKRGLSEINDRIRWSERLSIISVGDSSI